MCRDAVHPTKVFLVLFVHKENARAASAQIERVVDPVKSITRSILNIPRDYVPSKYLKDLSKENTSAYPVSQKNAVRTLNFRPLAPLHNEPHFSPNNTLIHV